MQTVLIPSLIPSKVRMLYSNDHWTQWSYITSESSDYILRGHYLQHIFDKVTKNDRISIVVENDKEHKLFELFILGIIKDPETNYNHVDYRVLSVIDLFKVDTFSKPLEDESVKIKNAQIPEGEIPKKEEPKTNVLTGLLKGLNKDDKRSD